MHQCLRIVAALSTTFLSAAGLSASAYAATSVSDMAVTANIGMNCTMSTTDLAFGAYDPIVANATTDLTASATVSTNCSLGAFVVVRMGNGLHGTSSAGRSRMAWSRHYSRHMSNAVSGSKLQYELYTNEGHTDVWTQLWGQSVVGTGVSDDLTVYGKVFKNQQTAAAGSYSDTVTVTVLF